MKQIKFLEKEIKEKQELLKELKKQNLCTHSSFKRVVETFSLVPGAKDYVFDVCVNCNKHFSPKSNRKIVSSKEISHGTK